MASCANCPSPATKIYQVGPSSQIFYCSSCLPAFLRTSKYSDLVKNTDFFEEKKKQALEKLSAPKAPAKRKRATKSTASSSTAPRKRKPRATTKKSATVETTIKEEIDTLDIQIESTEEVTQ